MKRFVLFSLSIILLNCCTTQMYVPNAINAPLLRERGEVQVVVTQNDLQAAVGLNRNFGIMANGFYKNYVAENNYVHGGMLGEVGFGYFKNLDRRFVFESFLGAGAGNVYKQKEFRNGSDELYTARFKAQAARFFIQPDFGFRSKVTDLVLSSRFSFVKYTRFNGGNYPMEELERDYLDHDHLTGPLFMFAEPALTWRLGYKYVKFQFQTGMTINMTGNNIRYAKNFSSFGVIINVTRWYQNEEK
jgi:hypothetical protein